jgi:membrane dipeptidase
VIPVLDGHNDVLLQVEEGRRFDVRSDEGHIDVSRAREAGFAGGFFSVFVEGPMPGDESVREQADGWVFPDVPAIDPRRARCEGARLARRLLELEVEGALAVARDASVVERAVAGGPIAAVMHLEGAEPVGARLGGLEPFVDLGVRSIGIVWSRPNAFGEGVPFRFPASPDIGDGLTAAGRRLVKRCNELGVLVDLAHLNLRGFFDAAHVSDAPLVVTHTAAHAVCPMTRCVTDEQLDAVTASGGVVGVAFDVTMLVGSLAPDTPLDPIYEHVEHMVDRMGIDHVAFGSDFDGATVPDAVGDVRVYPKLLDGLRRRGYDDDALAKIAHGNWLRVLRDTWQD